MRIVNFLFDFLLLLILYQWLDSGTNQLNGLHQFFMRHFGSVHLKSKPANTAECIGMTQNLCHYLFNAANKQRPFWSYLRLEPASCHRWPAAFFANLGHSLSIAGIKFI